MEQGQEGRAFPIALHPIRIASNDSEQVLAVAHQPHAPRIRRFDFGEGCPFHQALRNSPELRAGLLLAPAPLPRLFQNNMQSDPHAQESDEPASAARAHLHLRAAVVNQIDIERSFAAGTDPEPSAPIASRSNGIHRPFAHASPDATLPAPRSPGRRAGCRESSPNAALVH